MATMHEVIEYVDGVKPNVYSDEDKCGWISRIENTIRIEVHGEEPRKYSFPQDADNELCAPHPFDDVYSLYVMAMIDYHNKEINGYNQTAVLFADRLEAYKRYYIQRNPHGKAKNFRNVMG